MQKNEEFSQVMGIEISEMIELFHIMSDPLKTSPVTPLKIWSFTNKWDEYKQLNQKQAEFKNIISGQGYYEIDGAGKAVNPDFGIEAQELWEKIRNTISATRTSFPDGYDAQNQPVSTRIPVAQKLESIVYQQFADKFNLNVAAV
jgi:hypothetical protein